LSVGLLLDLLTGLGVTIVIPLRPPTDLAGIGPLPGATTGFAGGLAGCGDFAAGFGAGLAGLGAGLACGFL
jgi:hypothetical protein